MRGSLFHDLGKVTTEEIKEEELQEGDVQLRVNLCGVCGSDIKTFVRGTPYINPPAVLGHEVVGTVEKSKNTKWKTGDRVAVVHYLPCGSCEYCLTGKATLCPHMFERKISPGGFVEYLRIPKDLADRGTFKLSDGIDFEQVVLAEPLACCIHGIKKVGIPIGSTVQIIGDGPMGLLHAQAVRAYGASTVIMSGMTSERLKVGQEFADHIINANDTDVSTKVDEITEGKGPDVIIVAVASVPAARQAMEMVKNGGSVLLFGGFPKDSELSLDPNRIHYDEVKLVGSVGSLPEDFAMAVKLLESNQVKYESMLTNRYSLNQVPLALERGSNQKGVKSIIDPWAPDGTDEKLKNGDE